MELPREAALEISGLIIARLVSVKGLNLEVQISKARLTNSLNTVTLEIPMSAGKSKPIQLWEIIQQPTRD